VKLCWPGQAEQFMTRKANCIVTASQAGGTARLLPALATQFFDRLK